MASKRQIEANRVNAKRSTGPKTDAGKAQSSGNARRHGLSRLGKNDLTVFAGTIPAGLVHQSHGSIEQGLVQAKFRLSQIRDVRCEMLAALLECPSPKQMKRLAGLERYEKKARAEQRRVLRRLQKG